MPVSQAVQASTALPGLYRPVRIGGRDYVDGGVKKTAHINLAIQHGADLVICINPIVPILNDTARGPLRATSASAASPTCWTRCCASCCTARMQYGLERYRREHPEVDILLLEPTRDDLRMFSYNIMRYSARKVVAEHGYRSTLAFFQQNRKSLTRILARHGIRLQDTAHAPVLPARHPYRSTVARALGASLERLGSRVGSRAPRAARRSRVAAQSVRSR